MAKQITGLMKIRVGETESGGWGYVKEEMIERRKIELQSFEGYYASRDGRVWKKSAGGFWKEIAASKITKGHKQNMVKLINHKGKHRKMPRCFLVLVAFTGHRGEWFKAVHRGDKGDDCLKNLKWELKRLRINRRGMKGISVQPGFYDILDGNDKLIEKFNRKAETFDTVRQGRDWHDGAVKKYEQAANKKVVDWSEFFNELFKVQKGEEDA